MPAHKRISDEQIITELLKQGSIKYAAKSLDCRSRTISDRMKLPQFKELFNEKKREMLQAATLRLQSMMSSAVGHMFLTLSDEEATPATRLEAAKSILSFGLKFTETTDIMERLEALEEAVSVDE